MSDPNDPMAWVEIAEEDYATARYGLQRREPLVTTSCFHSQQCAEKYLKAILVFRRKAFPKTHDLDKLKNLCEQAGVIVPISSDPLDLLTMYAVEKRYPGRAPTRQDARDALATAKLVRQFARKTLGLK